MATYVVLSHDEDATAKAQDKTVFVRDAFSWLAFAAPVLWLLWQRLWFAATLGLCFLAALVWAMQTPQWLIAALLLNFGISILVATEGSAWKLAAFKRSGYKLRGVVEAERRDDAQLLWSHRRSVSEEAQAPKARVFSSPAVVTSDDLILGGQV